MEEREPTNFEKGLATTMGAIASTVAGPVVGAFVKWFYLHDKKSPYGYDMATDNLYRRDTGEYI
jgi:hypothetical protein